MPIVVLSSSVFWRQSSILIPHSSDPKVFPLLLQQIVFIDFTQFPILPRMLLLTQEYTFWILQSSTVANGNVIRPKKINCIAFFHAKIYLNYLHCWCWKWFLRDWHGKFSHWEAVWQSFTVTHCTCVWLYEP